MMLLPLLAGLIAAPITITHVSLIDLETGRAVPDQTIVIDGDRFEAIGNSDEVQVSKASRVIDGKGLYAIPGLWDMHIHAADPRHFSLFTANGVTGVRDMFGAPIHLAWRNQFDQGKSVGPKMVVAGPIVDGPTPIWPGSIAVGNYEEGRQAVKKVVAGGYDFVKVYSLLPADGYRGIVDEAKASKISFAGHIPNSMSIVDAARSGQRSGEHTNGLVKLADKPYELNLALSEMKKQKMAWCPTLTVLRAIANLKDPKFTADPRLKYMPKWMITRWDPANDFRFKSWTPEQWAKMKRDYGTALRLAKQLHDSGILLFAGTDCMNPYCFPGFSLHDELELLVEAGLSNRDALRTATRNAGEFFKRRVGRIQVGYEADLVLLDANPLEKIGNTRKIRQVVQRGILFERKELDAMLEAAIASAGNAPPTAGGYLPDCDQ